MAKSYSELNKRNLVLEPNLSRQRLAFKGPVPSTVLNLYYDQFIVDTARLSSLAETINSSADQLSEDYWTDFSVATPNYYIDDELSSMVYYTYKYYDSNLDEQTIEKENSMENLEFQKYGINSSRLSYLDHKIKMLEDLIGKKE